MNAAEWMVLQFKANAVERIFTYPGGTIVPMINACLDAGIGIECFKNEQGAGYAALAYARLTGRPQIVLVTSGPGATNALTPLADAFYDSVPLIFITGQIGTSALQSRPSVRQRGFQETPTVAMATPISKRAVCLVNLPLVLEEVPMAFRIAMEGRKGPVLLDAPMNIQRSEMPPGHSEASQKFGLQTNPSPLCATSLSEITQYAIQAQRQVILLGHGALDAGAFAQYAQLAKKLDAFVVSSLLGLGSYHTKDARYLGYIGHTGNLAANRAVHDCDFLLVLGARLDIRQTGDVADDFVPNGKVAWVDLDPEELANPRVLITWKLQADAGEFVNALLATLPDEVSRRASEWRREILAIRDTQPEDPPLQGSSKLQPREVLSALDQIIGQAQVTVTTGVGCHQHWAARHLTFTPIHKCFLTSGGHGAMGYDLPAALGAALAQPERKILCVAGDGSLLMNIQELATLREKNLQVKILVLNNSRLAMVSQFQLITWGQDPTTGDFQAPNFADIAQGFHIASDRLEKSGDMVEKLSTFWNSIGPFLLEVLIDAEADVVPMLLAGQKMNTMWMGRNA